MAGEANYRLMTEATGQRIAAALESLVNLGDPVTIAHGGTGASTAAAALAALGGVAVTDIVDNLSSTATNKPLSANMGKTLSDKVTTKTAITITPGTHISIDQNDTYYCGETVIIDFKCHTTAAIGATETIATLNTPNSRFLKQSGSIVPLIKGAEWGVSGIAYGYINTRTISSNNLASGDYLHVYFTAFLD